MNDFPSQSLVVDAVLDGIKTAKQNYTFWTADELYLSYAPQNFLSIHVAQSIAKITKPPEIFIDATIADILRCSLPKRDAFKDFMKKNGIKQSTISLTLDERFEHLSDNDSVSRVIITLKNGVRNAKDEYKNDVETICKMLSREYFDDSTLDYGIFAFYLDISSSARIKAEKRVEDIVKTFDEIVSSFDNLKSHFKGGEIIKVENIGEWCVGCYIIEPIV
jgi:hypothetical protein